MKVKKDSDMSNGSMKGRILEYISVHSDAHCSAPSYREIASAVGLKSAASVCRYIGQLKLDGRLAPVGQKVQAIALVRRVALENTTADPRRVRLEVADGGVVFLDRNLEKDGNDPISVCFTGILDASQVKCKIGRVVNCQIEDGG